MKICLYSVCGLNQAHYWCIDISQEASHHKHVCEHLRYKNSLKIEIVHCLVEQNHSTEFLCMAVNVFEPSYCVHKAFHSIFLVHMCFLASSLHLGTGLQFHQYCQSSKQTTCQSNHTSPWESPKFVGNTDKFCRLLEIKSKVYRKTTLQKKIAKLAPVPCIF